MVSKRISTPEEIEKEFGTKAKRFLGLVNILKAAFLISTVCITYFIIRIGLIVSHFLKLDFWDTVAMCVLVFYLTVVKR
jgi:hypothetical protein